MSRHRLSEAASRLKIAFSIRARLVLLALILVVPLMVERVMVLEHTRANQVRLATDELNRLAKHSAAAQREIISSVEAMLKSAAYIQVASDQTGGGCAVLRASLTVEMPWINSLSVVGKNGRIACSTAQGYVGLDITDSANYQKTLDSHGFVLSDLVVSRVTHKPLLLASYPTTAVAQGEPSVIIAGLNIDWMSKLMSSLGERPGVIAVLVDSSGKVLAAQPTDRDVIGQPYQDIALDKLDPNEDVSSTLQMSNGVKKLVAVVRIPNTQTRMIVSIDHEMMLAPINHTIEKAYLALAFVSFFALLGAWFAGEQFIIRPIRLITNMANRFGHGDLSARAAAQQVPFEFKPLAVAFNTMAAQLAERERDLLATNDRLTVMASLDLISGLANRRGLQSRLDFEWMKALQTSNSLTLMMIDVDHFKQFNDNYGHPEGDACLGQIGAALTRIANETMGFAARYGGEEFCLLLPNADREHAVATGEMIRQAIEQLAIPHAMSAFGCVTVSVGVAMVAPNAGQRPDDLIEAADAALYAAKHRGRNAVVEHGLVEALAAPVLLAV